MSRGRLAWSMLVVAMLAAGCAKPRAGIPVAPAPGWEEMGHASWYGVPYHGRRTASGEVYDMHQMTAAHRTLPFGTWLAVRRVGSGRTVDVRVNDRGPFVDGRVLDLSYAAAVVLEAVGPGVIPVRLRVIPPPAAAPAAVGRRIQAPLMDGDASMVAAAAGQATFAVQLGAFAEENRARELQRELERLGWEARVEPATLGETVLYRVRIGRFDDRQAAAAVARELAGGGRPATVVAE